MNTAPLNTPLAPLFLDQSPPPQVPPSRNQTFNNETTTHPTTQLNKVENRNHTLENLHTWVVSGTRHGGLAKPVERDEERKDYEQVQNQMRWGRPIALRSVGSAKTHSNREVIGAWEGS